MRLHFSVFGMKKKNQGTAMETQVSSRLHIRHLKSSSLDFLKRERVVLNVMREIGSVHYGGTLVIDEQVLQDRS